jgi:signal transduction histidine kinase
LAGTILAVTLHLRHTIREQIANRDGLELHAVSLLQQFADANGDPTGDSLAEPTEQLDLLINISRIKRVLGLRLFSPGGEFINAFPANITEATLPAGDLARLGALQPVSHFVPWGLLEEVDLFSTGSGATVPLLIVNVPLHSKNEARLVGIAQFILHGESIAREFRLLDRSLFLQAAVVFLSGGILTLALAMAFRRLRRVNRLLSERTFSLLRANQELALAAKTSALGALTTHLIHGLKSPLSSLQSFARERVDNQDNASEWQEAIRMTRRMQNLIGEVVRILGEQQMASHYEVTLSELLEMVSARVLPTAQTAGLQFSTRAEGEGALANREAALVLLILENLAHNAIEATPRGKSVWLQASAAGGQVVFEVRDEGPGLPAGMAEVLFRPCRSTKEGGSGIGLAISRQLALHIGAALELEASSAQGCVFRLAVPLGAGGAALVAETAPGQEQVG